jgi:hypothetical protein
VSIDPAIKRLVRTIAQESESDYMDAEGNIDTAAHSRHILDAIEQRHEDILSLLNSEAPLWAVEQVVKEYDRKSRAAIKGQYAKMMEGADDVADEARLPGFEKIRKIKVAIHKGGERFDKKLLPSCSIRELDIIDQGYGGLIDTMTQHQQYVRVLARLARSMGLKDTDTVRDLYKKSA